MEYHLNEENRDDTHYKVELIKAWWVLAIVIYNLQNILHNVDILQLRRIHILEQERQVLTSGLQALERARDWFSSQLNDVQERIKSFGKSSSGSNVTE